MCVGTSICSEERITDELDLLIRPGVEEHGEVGVDVECFFNQNRSLVVNSAFASVDERLKELR